MYKKLRLITRIKMVHWSNRVKITMWSQEKTKLGVFFTLPNLDQWWICGFSIWRICGFSSKLSRFGTAIHYFSQVRGCQVHTKNWLITSGVNNDKHYQLCKYIFIFLGWIPRRQFEKYIIQNLLFWFQSIKMGNE